MATDYYRLRIQGLHQTEYNECVLHFRGTNLTAADYLANANDLVAAFIDAALPGWQELMPESYQVLRLTASKASLGGGGEVSTQFDFGSNPGLVTGGAASQQLCPVILLIPPMGVKTAGKIFLPAIPESRVQGNIPSATWLTDVGDLMTVLISGMTFGSITWDSVIYSRKNGSFAEVVDYSTSPVIGFQRRRQRSAL